jgi:hypothetical protein
VTGTPVGVKKYSASKSFSSEKPWRPQRRDEGLGMMEADAAIIEVWELAFTKCGKRGRGG